VPVPDPVRGSSPRTSESSTAPSAAKPHVVYRLIFGRGVCSSLSSGFASRPSGSPCAANRWRRRRTEDIILLGEKKVGRSRRNALAQRVQHHRQRLSLDNVAGERDHDPAHGRHCPAQASATVPATGVPRVSRHSRSPRIPVYQKNSRRCRGTRAPPRSAQGQGPTTRTRNRRNRDAGDQLPFPRRRRSATRCRFFSRTHQQLLVVGGRIWARRPGGHRWRT